MMVDGVIPWRHERYKVVGTWVSTWFRRVDDQPWLVICHGGGLDSSGFRAVADAMSDEWNVLLWDLPGHGASDPLPDGLSLEGCADAMSALLDRLAIVKPVILGFSFGGVVAQTLFRRQPDRYRALLSYACFMPDFVTGIPSPRMARLLVIAAFGWRRWPSICRRFAKLCARQPLVRARIEETMAPLGKQGFMAMAAALLAARGSPPAMAIPRPAAFLHGDSDANLPRFQPMLRRLQAAYPELSVVVIPDAGHCAHEDNPTAFIAALRAVLADTFPGQDDRT